MDNLIFYIFAALFGLAVGSFLNALVWRLRNKKSIAFSRSQCPKCKHVLTWLDLMPVLSFVFLGGKCRYCHKKISWQYPLVELATAVLFVLAVFVHGPDFQNLALILRDWFFIGVLMQIFIYDLKWNEILDQIILPAIIIVLAVMLLMGNAWDKLFLAAGLGAVFFLVQYAVSRGKWIGAGDIRMGALMGFMVGWPNILVAMFTAYVVGTIVALPLIFIKKKKFNSTIALGTFLAAGTLIALFWGNDIIAWYLGIA